MKNVNELFNLKENQDGTVAVSGRELHKGLEIETPYKQWLNRMVAYGFEENTDYILVTQKSLTNNPRNPYTNQTDHIMTLDMAKEIAMIQRSEIGKKIRKYFIEVEKSYKQLVEQTKDSYMIDDPVERAKRWIEEAEQRKQLETDNAVKEQIIGELQPKADYVDKILESTGTMTITQIAADYGLTAQKLNKLLKEAKLQRQVGKQWVLYANHMNKGYTKSHTINITRTDGSPDTMPQTRWTQKGRLKIHDVLTELGYEAQLTEI